MAQGFAAVFWGVVTFSLLVVIHEGGHFLAARFFGVKVHEFMVGLPGPALRWEGKKTTYGVTMVPLGGYVRIAGMEPGPEEPLLGPALAFVTRTRVATADDVAVELGVPLKTAEQVVSTLVDWDALDLIDVDGYRYRARFEEGAEADPVALLDRARSVTYRALKTWQRIVVLSAGVVLNLLTAVLVFTVVLSFIPYGQETGRIDTVSKGSAAEKAGIKPGDQITAIGGVRVGSFEELVLAVARFTPGETVEVALVRDGKPLTVSATLDLNTQTRRALLGVSPQIVEARLSPWQAFMTSFQYIWLTLVAIAGLFNPQTFQATTSLSSSVIGASIMAADAARAGIVSYAGIIAGLSLSLGIINVVPIPPLDGGKIALEIIERVRGRQLSRRFSLGLSLAGAGLLFALVGYLMYADVQRILLS